MQKHLHVGYLHLGEKMLDDTTCLFSIITHCNNFDFCVVLH